ncbi:MAG: hypothetical protein KKE50_04305 [Nanoarchaeota archaeon]|nr:hypothetical protein [Nanoarchaeota archaeon]
MNLSTFFEEIEGNLKEKFGQTTRIWVWPDGDNSEYKDHPEIHGVKGFYGNGIVNNSVLIWITERPSLARDKRKEHKFPDWIDKAFYKMLTDSKLQNMHLTDFVKVMHNPGVPPTERELKESVFWMKKEIKLLKKPNKNLIIIANTKRVKEWLGTYFPEYSSERINFFKGFFRYGKQEKLKQILQNLYEKTGT